MGGRKRKHDADCREPSTFATSKNKPGAQGHRIIEKYVCHHVLPRILAFPAQRLWLTLTNKSRFAYSLVNRPTTHPFHRVHRDAKQCLSKGPPLCSRIKTSPSKRFPDTPREVVCNPGSAWAHPSHVRVPFARTSWPKALLVVDACRKTLRTASEAFINTKSWPNRQSCRQAYIWNVSCFSISLLSKLF